jgi:hypothetical protein
MSSKTKHPSRIERLRTGISNSINRVTGKKTSPKMQNTKKSPPKTSPPKKTAWQYIREGVSKSIKRVTGKKSPTIPSPPRKSRGQEFREAAQQLNAKRDKEEFDTLGFNLPKVPTKLPSVSYEQTKGRSQNQEIMRQIVSKPNKNSKTFNKPYIYGNLMPSAPTSKINFNKHSKKGGKSRKCNKNA